MGPFLLVGEAESGLLCGDGIVVCTVQTPDHNVALFWTKRALKIEDASLGRPGVQLFQKKKKKKQEEEEEEEEEERNSAYSVIKSIDERDGTSLPPHFLGMDFL